MNSPSSEGILDHDRWSVLKVEEARHQGDDQLCTHEGCPPRKMTLQDPRPSQTKGHGLHGAKIPAGVVPGRLEYRWPRGEIES